MERNRLWAYVHTERAALAEMLAGLTPDEWETESLCLGWRVRDVAAHVISSASITPAQQARALLHGKLDFDRSNLMEGRRRGLAAPDAILADYHTYSTSRRRPLGTRAVDPLLDVLVHTQDIAIPLGRVHAMPTEAAATAAQRVWAAPFPFSARTRLAGFHLAATDIPWEAGSGPLVEGPIEALLMLLTGRRAWLNRLSGPGKQSLPTST
jgi:uncharacterized protein (TIGR03083 family)